MNPPAPTSSPGKLDLSGWRNLPMIMIVAGALVILGYLGFSSPEHDKFKEFGFSWLEAFMYFLSLCLGGLGLVILHHLFDASWSVPIRRICEHLACLLPVMAVLFVPLLFLAPRMYPWMDMLAKHDLDHALKAKLPLFTMPGYYTVVVVCFVIWTVLSNRLRHWSLKQDETGAVQCTRMMRRYAAVGVILFAFSLTIAAIMWMKSLQHEWFSTMYGVQYFAASMWVTLYTLYVITVILKRTGPLREAATDKTFYFIGSLMFAFTVFYAYVTFFQYFIIWNANMPEETFYYVTREKGTWWDIGMVIIFGHFLLPFLLLLRIDVKVSFLWVMLPLAAWAWLMHFVEISWDVMPVHRPDGFRVTLLDLGCLAFIGGVLAKVFLRYLASHPIIPQKDPRFAEAMDIYVEPEPLGGGLNPKPGGGH
jgi:hypothetical protein